jgi:hypothetical protein
MYFERSTIQPVMCPTHLLILHHEIKAHVLPLIEAEGLAPGREIELICVRLKSEMLRELGLPERKFNWGRDDGTLDYILCMKPVNNTSKAWFAVMEAVD